MIETMIILAIVAVALAGRLNQQYHRAYADQANLIVRQQAELGEVMRDGANLYERGLIQGMADTEAKWKAKPLYQCGLEVGKQAGDVLGYKRGWAEALEAATEMDTVRQSGELHQDIKELTVG